MKLSKDVVVGLIVAVGVLWFTRLTATTENY